MNNRVLNGLGFNDEVRFFIVDSKELVEELRQKMVQHLFVVRH